MISLGEIDFESEAQRTRIISLGDNRIEKMSHTVELYRGSEDLKIIFDLGIEFGIEERSKLEKLVRFFRRSIDYTAYVALPSIRRTLFED